MTPKILVTIAVIAAVAACAWFFALRQGAAVWVLQSISMVAVIAGISIVANAMKRSSENEQE